MYTVKSNFIPTAIRYVRVGNHDRVSQIKTSADNVSVGHVPGVTAHRSLLTVVVVRDYTIQEAGSISQIYVFVCKLNRLKKNTDGKDVTL